MLETLFDAVQIVKTGNDNVFERCLRHAGAAGNGIRRVRVSILFRLGLDADERCVMQSVVGAFELQDLVAAGGRARDAAGMHGDFGSAGAEAHHLHRIALADFFRKLPFLLVRHAKGGSFMQLLFDGLDDGGMAMAGHQRAETKVVVDVFVAVNVMNATALSILPKERLALVMAVGVCNSSTDSTRRPLVTLRP